MSNLGSRPREDIGHRPLNHPKCENQCPTRANHLANQLPARSRQPWGPNLSSDKSIQTHGSFEPGELRAGVQEHTHYLSVSMQKEGQWAHPGPPRLPGMTVKVPNPPRSPHGSASSKDFEFVKSLLWLLNLVSSLPCLHAGRAEQIWVPVGSLGDGGRWQGLLVTSWFKALIFKHTAQL